MATGVTALGVVSVSCLNTSGLADGPEPPADASLDTSPANPNPCGKDLQNDPGNCGMCGNACGIGANSFPLCTAGVCKIGCNTQNGNCEPCGGNNQVCCPGSYCPNSPMKTCGGNDHCR